MEIVSSWRWQWLWRWPRPTCQSTWCPGRSCSGTCSTPPRCPRSPSWTCASHIWLKEWFLFSLRLSLFNCTRSWICNRWEFHDPRIGKRPGIKVSLHCLHQRLGLDKRGRRKTLKEDFLDKGLHLVSGHRHQRDEVPEHVRVLQVRHLRRESFGQIINRCFAKYFLKPVWSFLKIHENHRVPLLGVDEVGEEDRVPEI